MASLVQSKPEPDGGEFSVNVGDAERVASAVGGGLLALYGLGKASLGGLAIAAVGGAIAYRGLSGHCSVYHRLGRSTADADAHGRTPSEKLHDRGVHVEVSYTVAKPRAELYDFWRDFTHLPKFMRHLQRVTVADGGKRSHWVTEGPAGMTVSWDADLINDVPNELIAWHSVAGGDVDTAGSIRFTDAPGGRGTEVKVSMQYIPPGGKLGAAVAKLFGKSGQAEVCEDLRRFKRLIETGEIPTIEGQSHGARSVVGKAVLAT